MTAEFEKTRLTRPCQSAGSYLSASDSRIVLGLPGANKVKLTIRWSDGTQQTRDVTTGELNRYLTVTR